MERRKAITVAASASLTLLAGAGGIALNSQLLGASADDGAGKISPVIVTNERPAYSTRVDEQPSVTSSTAPEVTATDAAPVTESSGSSVAGRDDHDDDDHDRDHDRDHDDDHDRDDDHDGRSKHRKYKGADDDD